MFIFKSVDLIPPPLFAAINYSALVHDATPRLRGMTRRQSHSDQSVEPLGQVVAGTQTHIWWAMRANQENGKHFRSGAGHVDILFRRCWIEFSKYLHAFNSPSRYFAKMPASAVQLAKRAFVRLLVVRQTSLLLPRRSKQCIWNTEPVRKFFLFLYFCKLYWM